MRPASSVLSKPRAGPRREKRRIAIAIAGVIHAHQKPDARTVRFVAAIKRLKGIL